MEGDNFGSLDTLVQQKIEQDADFQSSLEELDDESREQALHEKRTAIIHAEFERLKKADDLAKNYKVRAEKAEDEARQLAKQLKPDGEPKTPTKKADDGLSVKDSYALQAAGVPFEDVDEVVKAAKLLDKSIPEALKDSLVISRLAQLKSYRDTEQAANIKPKRSGASEVSDDKLLDDLAKGNIPKPGSKEAERLFLLRRHRK